MTVGLRRSEPLNDVLVVGQTSTQNEYFELPQPVAAPVGGLAKRIFDIISVSLLLVALSPVLICVAFAVKISSPGSMIFKQSRIGWRGETFEIYKFRTMHVSENSANVTQAIRGDARLTSIGAFLRRTSLDELPQLFNVLKGEMSLVGPRPHAVAHDHNFEQALPSYQLRRVARPGITGLAQIKGARGPILRYKDIRRRAGFDRLYVENWSVWNDVLILLKTAFMVLRDKSAF
ncbi:MAG: exopolysaccharide biosynthesis polyprenyl glycosylphosphotransferase [Pseudomonadota bacterium]